MKNILSLFFLTFTLLIYSNPIFNISSNAVSNSSSKSIMHFEAPTTSPASITILEGGQVEIDLSEYTEGSADSYTIVSQPNQKAENGFQDLGNGRFSYQHNGSEAPTDTFTFKATNGNDDSNISTITINVTNVNDAPTVTAVTKTLDEGSSVEITVIGKDAENSELTFTYSTPNNGTVTVDATTGLLTYTHDGSDTIEDSFDVTAHETATTTNTQPLSSSPTGFDMTITAVNDAPITVASAIAVDEGSQVSGMFTASDSDSAALTSSVSINPVNGTVDLESSTPLNFVYTHDGSETTSDVFTFNISDAALSSSKKVTVTVTPVNDVPTANNDNYYIASGGIDVTTAGTGLLSNDVDAEANDMTATLVTNGSSGTATVNSDGTFSYTPSIDNTTTFNSDTFTYTANDGSGDSVAATVTVTLKTLIPKPDTYSLNEGATLQVSADDGVLKNDIDTNNFGLDSITVVTQPKYGTLTLDHKNGSFSYAHDSTENLKDLFEYKVMNSNEDQSEVTFVNLYMDNVNDAPTSTGTLVSLDEGDEVTFSLAYIDSDTPLSGITFAPTGDDPAHGNVIDNGSGSFRYIHDGGETTSDTFYYTVSDGEYTTDAVAVTIAIAAVNDKPTATALNISVSEGGTVSPLNFAGTDVETTDSSLTYKLVSIPTNGAVSSTDAGVFSYVHNGSETTSDSFQYQAYDGTDYGPPALVTVAVQAVNSSPVTTLVTVTLDEGDSTTYDLATLTTDSDTNSGIIYKVQVVSTNGALTDPNNSNAAVAAGGQLAGSTITYTHNGGETTTDSFTWFANDGNTDSNVSTFSLAVSPVNDAPTIDASTTIAVDEQDKVDITLLGSDAEGDALTYTIEALPTGGTLSDSGGVELSVGSVISSATTVIVTYTHTGSISANATDSFQLKAKDGVLFSTVATINIAITNINENLPQIILESSSNTVSEDVGNVTITASLVSNSFYSNRRDMDAAPVSANATNSKGFIYIGENDGHKYYLKEAWCD